MKFKWLITYYHKKSLEKFDHCGFWVSSIEFQTSQEDSGEEMPLAEFLGFGSKLSFQCVKEDKAYYFIQIFFLFSEVSCFFFVHFLYFFLFSQWFLLFLYIFWLVFFIFVFLIMIYLYFEIFFFRKHFFNFSIPKIFLDYYLFKKITGCISVILLLNCIFYLENIETLFAYFLLQ